MATTALRLVAIVVATSLLFMVMTILQEWQVFAPLLTADTEASIDSDGAPEVPEEARQALERFNTLIVHLYRFAGDQRFLDRLVAGDSLKREIVADLDYLARNGIVQSMRSLSHTQISEQRLQADVYELVTEEEWQLEYLDHSGTPVSARAMSFVITWRYVVKREQDGRWVVVAMGPADG
jgi:hypothetical protein